MAVLVTGASGFLGGRLAQVLAVRDAEVRILARAGRDLRHLEGLRVQVLTGGLSDVECLAEGVRGVTHIYHCAACATDWARWDVYFEANVAGVRNLLRAAGQQTSLERFLHVSTTDVYGYPVIPCDESHSLVDTGLPYNRSKRLGEEAVWEASGRAGLPVTVVRPATIWGPRGAVFARDIAKLLRRGLMAVIDGGRAPGGFCYVDNCVSGIIGAATANNTVGRAYNLSDGTGVTWRQYVDALAEGLGERRPWINLPSMLAFPLARAMEAVQRGWSLPGRPLLTRHAVYLLSRSQEFPVEAARRDFGFSPALSFEEGMRRTIEWLKRTGLD